MWATTCLLAPRWWDRPPEKIFCNLEALGSGGLGRVRQIV